METTTVKTYAKRDSAVSYLRKKGVPKEQYNEFLTLTTDQQYKLDTAEVEHFLATGQTPEDVAANALAKSVDQTSSEKAVDNAKKDPKLVIIPPDPGTKKAEKPVVDKKKAGKPAAEVKQPKRTVSSVCRTLIAEGKTNEEVWEAVRLLFDLPDTKKSYPAWYRADMKKKKGLI